MVEVVATVPFHRVLTLRDPGLQRNGNGFGADMVHVVVPEGVVVFFPQNRFLLSPDGERATSGTLLRGPSHCRTSAAPTTRATGSSENPAREAGLAYKVRWFESDAVLLRRINFADGAIATLGRRFKNGKLKLQRRKPCAK